MSTSTTPSTASKQKKATSAPASVHPKYSDMVQQALVALKERGGSSRLAVLKYIMANFKVTGEEHMINAHLKTALKSGVKNGTLKQTKGTGATGSFRIGEKVKPAAAKPKTGAATKTKKAPAAASKKPVTTAAKTAAAAKPKKVTKAPAAAVKKTNKPTAAKKTTAAAKKPAAKPTTASAAAAKKPKSAPTAKKSPVKKATTKKAVVAKPPKVKA
jgi:hypothetical protein